jgi:RimJ/RimL family protein N-acetyltransferase
MVLTPRLGDRMAELGFRLRREAWGRGYASEGAKALVAKGFAEMDFERIIARTMAVNQASRRVMEKAGLAHVRTVFSRWSNPLPGREMADVEYEIARSSAQATASKRSSGP